MSRNRKKPGKEIKQKSVSNPIIYLPKYFLINYVFILKVNKKLVFSKSLIPFLIFDLYFRKSM